MHLSRALSLFCLSFFFHHCSPFRCLGLSVHVSVPSASQDIICFRFFFLFFSFLFCLYFQTFIHLPLFISATLSSYTITTSISNCLFYHVFPCFLCQPGYHAAPAFFMALTCLVEKENACLCWRLRPRQIEQIDTREKRKVLVVGSIERRKKLWSMLCHHLHVIKKIGGSLSFFGRYFKVMLNL